MLSPGAHAISSELSEPPPENFAELPIVVIDPSDDR